MNNERKRVLLTASSTTPYCSKPWRRASSVVCHARPLLNRYLRKCVGVLTKNENTPDEKLRHVEGWMKLFSWISTERQWQFPEDQDSRNRWMKRKKRRGKSGVENFSLFWKKIFHRQSHCGCAWGCRWSVKQTEHTARQGTLTVETFVAERQRVLISQMN
jgi:hypothetical protein